MGSKLLGSIIAGEGKWIKYTYKEDGEARDMSGASFTFKLCSAEDEDEVVWTAGAGDIDTTDAATGVILANLPASVTGSLTAGVYYPFMKAVLVADTDVDIKWRKLKVASG